MIVQRWPRSLIDHYKAISVHLRQIDLHRRYAPIWRIGGSGWLYVGFGAIILQTLTALVSARRGQFGCVAFYGLLLE